MSSNSDADHLHGFDLPTEILAVIPTDPYEQLDVARKITSMAITSRVSALEAEAARLHHKLGERDRAIAELEDRLQITLEDNAKLVKERDSLASTSKKLGRDLMKLETFKRQLMHSLSGDNISPTERIEVGTFNQSSANNSSWKVAEEEGSLSRSASSNKISEIGNTCDSIQDESGASGYKLSLTPYITPHLTPANTPKVSSTGGSPRGFSTAVSSPRIISGTSTPRIMSGTSSPAKSRFKAHGGLSSWYPSSQQSSAPSSPPHRRTLPGPTRIDGKEFFRQTRSRLSYEQFGAFLANIKELNAQRQSFEATLEKAEEIFGTENRDLYLSFQRLLNLNLS